MANPKKFDFNGILLATVMFVSIIALFTSNPETTGFVVKESGNRYLIEANNQADAENNNIGLSCSGSIVHNTCSNSKPLFCENGQLVYNRYKCGCDLDETCSDYGICEPIKKCADGSIYGECSFLNGKFCDEGKLVFNCNLCGCGFGSICSDNR